MDKVEENLVQKFKKIGLLERASLAYHMEQAFTVDELKSILREKRLRVGGAKAELINRLIVNDQSKCWLLVHDSELLECTEKGKNLLGELVLSRTEIEVEISPGVTVEMSNSGNSSQVSSNLVKQKVKWVLLTIFTGILGNRADAGFVQLIHLLLDEERSDSDPKMTITITIQPPSGTYSATETPTPESTESQTSRKTTTSDTVVEPRITQVKINPFKTEREVMYFDKIRFYRSNDIAYTPIDNIAVAVSPVKGTQTIYSEGEYIGYHEFSPNYRFSTIQNFAYIEATRIPQADYSHAEILLWGIFLLFLLLLISGLSRPER